MRKTIEIIIGAVIGIIAMTILLTFLTSFLYSEKSTSMIQSAEILEESKDKTVIVWETTEPANGIVFYSFDGLEEKRVIVSDFVTAHRIEIKGHAGNIKIRTCNAVNKCSEHHFGSADK